MAPDLTPPLLHWHLAATFDERIRALRSTSHCSGATLNDRLADYRRKLWSVPAMGEASATYLQQRVSALAATDGEVDWALGGTADWSSGIAQGWVQRIVDAYERPPVTWIDPGSHPGFTLLVEPLARHGRYALERRLLLSPSVAAIVDMPSVLTGFTEHLTARLHAAIQRVCSVEMSLFDQERVMLEPCDMAEDGYVAFNALLSDPAESLKLLGTYPSLARLLSTVVDQRVEFIHQCLGCLATDLPLLIDRMFDGVHPGLVHSVDPTSGDPHVGGRCPLVVRFGANSSLVYKPRSLGIDRAFWGLTEWLNASGLEPALRTPSIVDGGTYGWMEFISHRACTSSSEIQRFFERQGALLAILSCLGASDLHRENVIAHGEHPIPVDLETVLRPSPRTVVPMSVDTDPVVALEHSVLQVGLLPRRVWGVDPWDGVDLSGLSGADEQVTPFDVAQWENAWTGSMRLVRRPAGVTREANVAHLGGQAINVRDHVDDLCLGFARAYRLLVQHRRQLNAPAGPLESFAGRELRVVLRPTRTYAVLLEESLHPHALGDAVEREQLFARLWSLPTLARDHHADVVTEEVRSMMIGDVPKFTADSDSRALRLTSGRVIENVFAETAVDVARSRLARLSDRDLERQLWIIRASIGAMATHDTPRPSAPPSDMRILVGGNSDSTMVRRRAMDLACTIGDRLADLALESDADVAWLGVTASRDERWALTPIGLDLYDGVSGIGLFFLHLGIATSSDHYLDWARRCFSSTIEKRRSADYLNGTIGGYTGLGGLVFCLAHAGRLLDDDTFGSAGRAVLDDIERLIEHDEYFDVIAGAAGCIVSLLSAFDLGIETDALELAIRCGDHLIRSAVAMEVGIGWVRRDLSARPLAGFSHGAAGVAWALSKLATASGLDRFRVASHQALAYERTLFRARSGNWLDLRTVEGQAHERFASVWCHGAPGIAMARLDGDWQIDDTMLAELQAAIDTTLRWTAGLDHSLCHGALGNLDIVGMASKLTAFPHLTSIVGTWSARIVHEIETDGPRSGVPLGLETPGLMTGLAGIGYGLLRIAQPDTVPSLLRLERPRKYNNMDRTQIQ